MAMYGHYQDWIDKDLFDINGDKIGSVDEVFYDENSGAADWLLVKTGLFGTKKSFIPVSEVRTDGPDLRTSFTKDRVKDAPRIDDQEFLSDAEEQRLYSYYGLDYMASSGQYSGTGPRMMRRPSQLSRSQRMAYRR